MEDLINYEIYFGTNSGLLLSGQYSVSKEVRKSVCNSQSLSPVTAMSSGRVSHEVITGHQNGDTFIYDGSNGKLSKLSNPINSPVVGFAATEWTVMAVLRSGQLLGMNEGSSDVEFMTDIGSNGNNIHVFRQNTFSVDQAFYSGTDIPFTMMDVDYKFPIYIAKKDRPNETGQTIPTFSDFHVMTKYTVACVTREGQLRIYDVRGFGRPVAKHTGKDISYTAASGQDHRVVVGSNRGLVRVFDLRSLKRPVKTIRAHSGAVTDVCCDPNQPVFATCGYDSMLCVYDIKERKRILRWNMVSQLSKLLFRRRSFALLHHVYGVDPLIPWEEFLGQMEAEN